MGDSSDDEELLRSLLAAGDEAAAPTVAPTRQRRKRVVAPPAVTLRHPHGKEVSVQRSSSGNVMGFAGSKGKQQNRSSTTTAAAAGASGAQLPGNSTPSVEEFSQLSVNHRSIGASMMRRNMRGRSFKSLRSLADMSRSGIYPKTLAESKSDWVTIGVLCAKGPVKTTSKGGKFTTWFLSDLDGSTMKIFLFDKAFQHHQHEAAGGLFVVLNPRILPPKAGRDGICFSISKPGEAAKIGIACEFAVCKEVCKNGKTCNMPTKKKIGACKYHLRQKLNKMMGVGNARFRMEGNITVPPNERRRRPVATVAAKKAAAVAANARNDDFFNAKKFLKGDIRNKMSLAASAGARNMFAHQLRQAEAALKASDRARAPSAAPTAASAAAGRTHSTPQSARIPGLSRGRQAGQDKLGAALRATQLSQVNVTQAKLRKKNGRRGGSGGSMDATGTRVPSRGSKRERERESETVHIASHLTPVTTFAFPDAPLVARGVAPGDSIQLDARPKKRACIPTKEDVVRRLQLQRKAGTGKAVVPPPKPGVPRRRHSAPDAKQASAAAKRRQELLKRRKKEAARQEASSATSSSSSSSAAAKGLGSSRKGGRGADSATAATAAAASGGGSRGGAAGGAPSELEQHFGALLRKHDIGKLRKQKSSFAAAAEEEGFDKLMQGLDKLERAEAVVNKMEEVTSFDVKGYLCKTCNIFSKRVPKACHAQHHNVKQSTRTKHFFRCRSCHKKESAFSSTLRRRCPKCNALDWVAGSMYTTSKPKVRRRQLKARGEEHAFSLRSNGQLGSMLRG